MTIAAGTLDDLMHKALHKLLRAGEHVQASRGWNRELVGVTFKLSNPRARLSHTEKRGRLFSGLGELTWYLSQSNQAEYICYYIDGYEENSEDDGTIHGAYGPRIFDLRGHNQLANVIETLKQKPTSRRAVIQLFEAGDLSGAYREVPCTCFLQFLVRHARLDMVVAMRSNDAYLGLPHDVFSFTMIQEIVARQLGYELGTYSHFAGSLHLYDKHASGARKYLDEGWQSTVNAAMPPMPDGDPWPSIHTLLGAEAAIRRGRGATKAIKSLHPYWQDLVRLLQIFRHFKRKEFGKIEPIRKQMYSVVYNDYIKKKSVPKRLAPRSGQPELFADEVNDADFASF